MTRVKPAEQRLTGDEPNSFSCEQENATLITYYNWYNYYHDNSQHKWIIEWMQWERYPESSIEAIRQLPDKYFTSFLCATARMLLNGNTIPLSCKQKLQDFIRTNVARKQEISNSKVVHVPDFSNLLIETLEEKIDEFFASKYKSTFTVTDEIASIKVRSGKVKQALDYYQKLASELASNDPVIKEGYGNLKPKQKKNYIQFVDDILSFLGKKKESLPVVVRKKRTPKKKPATQIVAKVQYLKYYAELKLKSVNPTDIIGASQCWIYNVRYKTLTKLVAEKATGLSVKGTTVTGFTNNTSLAKRLRKPQETLPAVLEAGKVSLRTLLDRIKTKTLEAKGRMGKDTIILRVVK